LNIGFALGGIGWTLRAAANLAFDLRQQRVNKPGLEAGQTELRRPRIEIPHRIEEDPKSCHRPLC
jgi:hypothetical protein